MFIPYFHIYPEKSSTIKSNNKVALFFLVGGMFQFTRRSVDGDHGGQSVK